MDRASDTTAGSDDRLINVLNISRSLKSLLFDAGYRTVRDVSQLNAADLSAELSISIAQAVGLLSQIGPSQAGPSRQDLATTVYPAQSQIYAATAADLLSSTYRPRFSTQSKSIDNLIGCLGSTERPSMHPSYDVSRKGKEKDEMATITPGMTIEICGPPGGGKTCVALGIVLSARLAGMNGSQGEGDEPRTAGEVLVVDTEGGLSADRINAAAETLMRTLSSSTREVTRGIHLVRIHTQVQMIGFLHTLDEWLEAHPKVNLIVIDTLSYHFRQPGLDMNARRRVMELVKQKIGQATTVYGCAAIMCNQLATKLLTAENKPANFDTGDRAILMPQLGDAWTTGKTVRLVLFRGARGDELRYAHASMSGTTRDQLPWACFDIDSNGLPCDVPESVYKSPCPTPPLETKFV